MWYWEWPVYTGPVCHFDWDAFSKVFMFGQILHAATHSLTHSPTHVIRAPNTSCTWTKVLEETKETATKRTTDYFLLFFFCAFTWTHCMRRNEREIERQTAAYQRAVRTRENVLCSPPAHVNSSIYNIPKYTRYSRRHSFETRSNHWTLTSRSTYAGVWKRDSVCACECLASSVCPILQMRK